MYRYAKSSYWYTCIRVYQGAHRVELLSNLLVTEGLSSSTCCLSAYWCTLCPVKTTAVLPLACVSHKVTDTVTFAMVTMTGIFVVGAALLYGPSPTRVGPPWFTRSSSLGHRTQPVAQNNQFTIYIPGRPSSHQKHARPLSETFKRNSRLGRTAPGLRPGTSLLK